MSVNVWTNPPHRGFQGCDVQRGRCGSEPVLLRGHAQEWPAMSKWSLDYLTKHVHDSAADDGKANVNEFAVGSCARTDHLYPEMLRRHARVANSPTTQVQTLEGFARAVRDKKESADDKLSCFGIIPLARINATHLVKDVVVSQWAKPPSAVAADTEVRPAGCAGNTARESATDSHRAHPSGACTCGARARRCCGLASAPHKGRSAHVRMPL